MTIPEKIFYLYKITNKINNKIYIGQTINVSNRWTDHKIAAKNNKPTQIIHHALIKHGLENFIFEVIASCLTQEDANDTEALLIEQYNSYISNGCGYNVTLGGANASKTEEWKQKVSEHHKQYYAEHPELIEKLQEDFQKWRQENPEALKGENSPRFGKPPPQASIDALVNYCKTTPPRKGKKNSAEHIRKSSEAHSGEKHFLFGKNHPEETKKKIGDGNRGKVRTQEMKDHISKVKKGNSLPNTGSFKPGQAAWNKKIIPSAEDLEIYNKYNSGQTIRSLAQEYNKLWKTIKKAIVRANKNPEQVI